MAGDNHHKMVILLKEHLSNLQKTVQHIYGSAMQFCLDGMGMSLSFFVTSQYRLTKFRYSAANFYEILRTNLIDFHILQIRCRGGCVISEYGEVRAYTLNNAFRCPLITIKETSCI